MESKIDKKYIGLLLPVAILILVFIALLTSINFGYTDSALNPYILFSIIILFLLIVLITSLIFLYLAFTHLFMHRKDILEVAPEDIRQMNDNELKDLLKKLEMKKEKIEYMMEIARSKYHKREMDEESLREIIKKNQEKLLEIELKMKELGEQTTDND